VSAGAAGVTTAAIPSNWAARAVQPLVIAGVLLAVLVNQGGFFATSWGWSSVALLLAIAVELVLRDRVELGRWELVFVGAVAALTGWTALSALWSGTTGTALLEAQRALLLLSVAAAVVLTARAIDVSRLLLALLGVVTAVALYALLTRAWPAHFPLVNNLAGYRLARPVGYWNGLGILVAAGAILALGFVAGRGPRAVRSAAAASLVPLALTLYFTFSRAGWIALAFGVLVALGATRERLRFIGWSAAVAVMPAIAVILATRLNALATLHAGEHAAARDGARLAVLTAVLAVVAVAVTIAGFARERRIALSDRARRRIGIALAAAALVAVAAAFAAVGRTPSQLVSRAYDRFTVPQPTIQGSLDQRLLSLSGNGRIRLWRVAWHDFRAHPWLGSGAGTYARAWAASRNADFPVQDAHGLYIETLAELGPFGLLLMLGVLLPPLVITLRRGARPAVAGAAGAYAAYLLHAGVDWDWELAGVTAVAVALGALLVVERRRAGDAVVVHRSARLASVAAAVVLAVALAGAYAGNSALAKAGSDVGHKRYLKADVDAARAHRLMPWSAQPLVLLGESALGQGELADARLQLRKALAIDDGDWQTWLDLALASRGSAQKRALAQAARLYPTSPQIKIIQKYGAP
jgi:O-antigen ligase/polysaccharide polymerase Wzy-like membrane protein